MCVMSAKIMSPEAERRLWRFFLEEARYKGMGGDRLVPIAVNWRFIGKMVGLLIGGMIIGGIR